MNADLRRMDEELSVLRALPHALGPEKSVLSSMLQEPVEYIGRAVELKLTEGHFYLPAHATLFRILLECYERGEAVELVGLMQRVLDLGLLETVGGAGYVTEVYGYAPNGGHFLTHLDFVKEKHTLRAIIRSCTEAIEEAYANPEDAAELLDRVEGAVLAIREGAEVQAGVTVKSCVAEVMEYFAGLVRGDVRVQGLTTGYERLDVMSQGLKAGEMWVIAARPSMGKTSLMMNMVEHVCLDLGKPVMVFSCEMSAGQLVQRLVFSRARYELGKVQRGMAPSRQDLLAIKRSAEAVAGAKLFLDDTPGITINDLRAKARRMRRDEGIGLIAIDYLQLMRSLSKQAANAREREIAEISAGLKGLAKELGVPVLVLAQLNRGPEARAGGMPRMSDLRESGAIEQDADLVGLLYRSAYYADDADARAEAAGQAELLVAKNRNGETGVVPLTFIAPLMRFETATRENESA